MVGDRGRQVIPPAEGVCLIRFSGHKHFPATSIVSTCFFSPGLFLAPQFFHINEGHKFTSLLLQAGRVGILLEAGPANLEAWLEV